MSKVAAQNAVHEATVALQSKLDRSMRQAGKMSVLLAEMEGKYVDRQCRLVDAIDQVHTLEAECLGHRIKADMWQKELDLLRRRLCSTFCSRILRFVELSSCETSAMFDRRAWAKVKF